MCYRAALWVCLGEQGLLPATLESILGVLAGSEAAGWLYSEVSALRTTALEVCGEQQVLLPATPTAILGVLTGSETGQFHSKVGMPGITAPVMAPSPH